MHDGHDCEPYETVYININHYWGYDVFITHSIKFYSVLLLELIFRTMLLHYSGTKISREKFGAKVLKCLIIACALFRTTFNIYHNCLTNIFYVYKFHALCLNKYYQITQQFNDSRLEWLILCVKKEKPNKKQKHTHILDSYKVSFSN